MTKDYDIYDRLAQAANDVTGDFHNWHARMRRFQMPTEEQGGKWFQALIKNIEALDAVLAEIDLMETGHA